MIVKNCERCGKRCQAVEKRNADASIFVRGDAETGKWCAECLVVHFFKEFDLGPISSVGIEQIEAIAPECFRLPHIREAFERVIAVAKSHYGAELVTDDFDWDEVIANWHLPFPKTGKGRRKRKP